MKIRNCKLKMTLAFLFGLSLLFFSYNKNNSLFVICANSTAFAQNIKVAMGSSLPPMHFFDAQGKLAGFEVDLVKLFAEENGLSITFINPSQNNSSSLNMVLNGEVDMAVNSITITDSRRKWVDFSEPYFESGTGLLINANIGKPFDFNNCTYLILKNTSYWDLLSSKVTAKYKYIQNIDEAISLIANEKMLDYLPYVFVYDWMSLQNIAETKDNLKVLNFIINKEKYAVAFQKGKVMQNWNSFIAQIHRDGCYKEIYEKWFGKTSVPNVIEVSHSDYATKKTSWGGSFLADETPKEDYVKYIPFLNSDLRLSKY